MKVNRSRLTLAMARACLTTNELATTAAMPLPTVNNVITGRGVRPATVGRIAKALGVDVTEIIEQEE